MGSALTKLEPGDHVCLPFRSDSERREAVSAFTTAALRGRFKLLLITSAELPERVHDRLSRAVPAYRAASTSGQVEVVTGQELYLASGRFDGDRMIHAYSLALNEAIRQGFPGLWVNADMAWAVDGPDRETLADYETDANALFTSGRMTAVCQYDRRLFDDETIADVCSAHPIIEGGAAFHFALVEHPPGLRLTGELDGTNRRVLASVLAPLARVPAPLIIDAAGVTYAGVEAAAMIARIAVLRGGEPTTVICGPQLRRILELVDTTRALTIRGLAG